MTAIAVASQISKIVNESERQIEIERIAKAYVELEIAIAKERRRRVTFRDRLGGLFKS
jgi:hypothetical protein